MLSDWTKTWCPFKADVYGFPSVSEGPGHLGKKWRSACDVSEPPKTFLQTRPQRGRTGPSAKPVSRGKPSSQRPWSQWGLTRGWPKLAMVLPIACAIAFIAAEPGLLLCAAPWKPPGVLGHTHPYRREAWPKTLGEPPLYGADHLMPRSSTAFDRTQMSSLSGFGLGVWEGGRTSGSPPEPPHPRPEGRTGETKGRREGRARGHWADMTPAEKDPLLRCLFLLGEKGNGRAERGGPPSWKKAICERRWERLIPSQWEHEPSVSAASAWALPRQATHSLCPSVSCKVSL